ncbi:DUF1242-domain-containing protein [Xylariaceae sp. FL0662B]|nr:DUF1242-domain-containing protein [Xylariaceae sp. FL0662B]
MSALFNIQGLLLVILLAICTSAYVHQIFPRILDANKDGCVAPLLEAKSSVLTRTVLWVSSGSLRE